jgi:hypothetical protein
MPLWSDMGLHPILKDLVEVLDTFIAMAAVIVGGLFAYFKFLRQRVFHSRLEPTVKVTRYELTTGREFLNVVAAIKNTGLAKVDLLVDRSALRVYSASPPPEATLDEVQWTRVVTLDVPDRHHWIEAQEEIALTWLVALPGHSAEVAYKTELRLAGTGSDWYADQIAPPASGATRKKENDDADHSKD